MSSRKSNAFPFAMAVAGLAIAITGPRLASQSDADWKQQLAAYQQGLQRPSLFKRTLARETLARTGDARALTILANGYAKPEAPVELNRYLIASIATRLCRAPLDAAVLADWRRRHAKADDAWLWHETLRKATPDLVPDLLTRAVGKGDPFLRAVAVEALCGIVQRGGDAEVLANLCREILVTLPRQEAERALAIETVGRVLQTVRDRVRSEPWREVADAVIGCFDDAATPLRTKVVLSRQLAHVFGVTNLGYESRWWRNELVREPVTTAPAAGASKTAVPFFSIRTIGSRFVYVIDASDSMCKRVSDRERRVLGPTTGPRSPVPEKVGDGEFVPRASELDWNRIVTRFDVGREFVRLSLESLQPEHRFAIVLFGDDAQLLQATPRLMPATARNVKAAIAELEAIQTAPPTTQRPDGVLRGRTNLHAGMIAAFAVQSAAGTERSSYVDRKAMLDGADSLFLLSDGAPSWDDFAVEDARDEGDQAGDQETGTLFQNRDRLIFYGPYARPPYEHLIADVERRNLFRKLEIHCVGIGEANHHLLEELAKSGGGRAIKIEGEKR